MNATEIISDALRLAGGLGVHETVAGEQVTTSLRVLNNMIRKWGADPYNLWARKEVTLFLDKSTESYLLGSASTDAEWAETWYYTKLSGTHASGATSLTVDSISNMAINQRIGIELSDGTRQWTTIKSAPSGTVPLTTALSGAASDDGTVFFYTSRPTRPLRVLHARRKTYNGSDIPVEVIPMNEYFDTPSKSQNGTPVSVAYKPTLTSGTLYVWQPTNSVQTVLGLSTKHEFAEFTTASTSPDFPEEWNETLVFNLADRLEPTYRILPMDRRQELKQEARIKLQENLLFDAEDGFMRFTA